MLPDLQPPARSAYHRLGHWVYGQRALVIGIWLLLMAFSLALTPGLEKSLSGAGMTYEAGAAHQTGQVLQRELKLSTEPITVVFQAWPPSNLASNPAPNPPPAQFGPPETSGLDPTAAAAVLQSLRSIPGIRTLAAPADHPEYRSSDGRTQYSVISLDPTVTDPVPVIEQIEDLLQRQVARRWRTFVTGKAVVDRDAQRISKSDLSQAELIALPLTLLVLLVVFGSWVAASLPIGMGLLTVSVTFGLLYFIAQRLQMSVLALNFTSMLGLGLGIDYSLLIVNRFREEMAAGSVAQAIERTMDTAGRAVFVSGATVGISLVCLMLFPISILRSIGISGSIVVLLSVAAALTVLPALLAVIGPRINQGRWLRPLRWRQDFWLKIARQVTRRSVLSLVSVLLIIALLSAPFLRAQFGLGDASILPANLPSRTGIEVIQRAFGPGETAPILLAIQTQERGERVLSDRQIPPLTDLVRRLQSDPRVARVTSLFNITPPTGAPEFTAADYQKLYAAPRETWPAGLSSAVTTLSNNNTTLIAITSRTVSHTDASHDLVQEMRRLNLPGLTVQVGGQAASEIDTLQEVAQRFPWILGGTMAITFVVLSLLFQSVVLPIKAILMNFLSIGASFGALVFVFQEGHLKQWLNFEPLGYLDILLPLVLFCVVFGLSMDYEVFLLTRIKEIYDESGDNSRSVMEGLQHTGGIITSAATLMIVVTGAFALTSIIFMKALGLGIALAILIDATLIRVILVPASMHLMGKWNWWAPRFLKGKR
jgi:putative drug exporter of the RND superfamily